MAVRTWRGTTNSNWSVATNWLEGAVPLVTDDVIFDASSPNCVLNTTGICLSINWVSFTNTFTFTNNLTVYGNVTLGSSMTIAGTGILIVESTTSGSTYTLTSNGKVFNTTLQLNNQASITNGAYTYTLADDWTVTNLLLTPFYFGVQQRLNGFNMSITGNFTMISPGGAGMVGTTNYKMTGTGTIQQTGGALVNNLEFNTTGVITIIGTFAYYAGTLKYTAGDVITSECILNLQSAPTLDCNGMFWHSVGLSSNLTLLSDLHIVNVFNPYLNPGFTLTLTGLFNIYLYGDLVLGSLPYEAFTLAGTSTLHFVGNKTATFTNINNNSALALPVVINKNGILNINTRIKYNTSTLTYIKGIVKSFNINKSLTASFTTSCTLINIHKIPFTDITINAGVTLTMNQFFSGTPYFPCKVYSGGNVYNINFTDRDEKLAKFVTVRNANIINRGQLMIITNYNTQVAGQTTNIGVRYNNQLPNGSPSNENTINNTYGYPLNGLVSDPSMIRRN